MPGRDLKVECRPIRLEPPLEPLQHDWIRRSQGEGGRSKKHGHRASRDITVEFQGDLPPPRSLAQPPISLTRASPLTTARLDDKRGREEEKKIVQNTCHYRMERKYLLMLDLNLIRSYTSAKTSEERSFKRTEVEGMNDLEKCSILLWLRATAYWCA